MKKLTTVAVTANCDKSPRLEKHGKNPESIDLWRDMSTATDSKRNTGHQRMYFLPFTSLRTLATTKSAINSGPL